jgi:hypothetical protein
MQAASELEEEEEYPERQERDESFLSRSGFGVMRVR